MCAVGILAFGSLIEDPGVELTPVIVRRIEGVKTPFPVEFARSSRSRDGAPTVVPVERGGCTVCAVILVLDTAIGVQQGADLLWRRETRNEESDKHYGTPKKSGPDQVVVSRLCDFHGVGTVLYTSIAANIFEPTPSVLAKLALASAKGEAGVDGKDGISYLLSLKRQGVQTPLMPEYESAILRLSGAPTLEAALDEIRTQSLRR
jgi:hypothetical protein